MPKSAKEFKRYIAQLPILRDMFNIAIKKKRRSNGPQSFWRNFSRTCDAGPAFGACRRGANARASHRFLWPHSYLRNRCHPRRRCFGTRRSSTAPRPLSALSNRRRRFAPLRRNIRWCGCAISQSARGFLDDPGRRTANLRYRSAQTATRTAFSHLTSTRKFSAPGDALGASDCRCLPSHR
jgi:hypothetical protein